MRVLITTTLLLWSASALAQAAPATPEVPLPVPEPAPRAEAQPDLTLQVAAPSQTPQPPGVLGTGDHPEEISKQRDIPWSLGLEWEQGYNAAGFDRGGQVSFNPEYAWGFEVAFGYTFPNTELHFSWSQGAVVELTDSDSTVSRQELMATDMSFGLSRPVTFELADDRRWKLTPSAGLIAPISKASQAANVVVGTRLGLGAAYSYDGWLENVTLNASAGYTRRWASSNVPSAEVPFPCLPAGQDVSRDCVHLGTSATSRDLFTLGGGISTSITKDVSAGLDVSFGWRLPYALDEFEENIATGTLSLTDDQPKLRTSRSIRVHVGYAFLPWLSSSLFLRNGFTGLGPDGAARGPFHTVDMEVGTVLSLSIDQLYLGPQSGAQSGPQSGPRSNASGDGPGDR